MGELELVELEERESGRGDRDWGVPGEVLERGGARGRSRGVRGGLKVALFVCCACTLVLRRASSRASSLLASLLCSVHYNGSSRRTAAHLALLVQYLVSRRFFVAFSSSAAFLAARDTWESLAELQTVSRRAVFSAVLSTVPLRESAYGSAQPPQTSHRSHPSSSGLLYPPATSLLPPKGKEFNRTSGR